MGDCLRANRLVGWRMAERAPKMRVFSIQCPVFSIQRRANRAKRLESSELWLHLTRLFQSQRDCVLQPRVARNELPWESPRKGEFNPERVVALRPQTAGRSPSPRGEGWGEVERDVQQHRKVIRARHAQARVSRRFFYPRQAPHL